MVLDKKYIIDYYKIVLKYSNTMTTISIPLKEELNNYIDEQVRLGNASSKADLIRRALIKYKEDEFVDTVRKATQEIKDGKALEGDLDTLAKGFE
jgi:Arc/MetJ-type ribon-helix-helix transcriptional regulator